MDMCSLVNRPPSCVKPDMEASKRGMAQQQLIAASVGGLVTALVVCPFDVVKTRMQVDTTSSNTVVQQQYKGTLDALSKIARNEGVLSLWRGIAPSLIMAIPNAAIYFNSYEILKKKLIEYNAVHSAITPLVAGSIARVITVTALAPLELVRTNVQALDPRRLKESGQSLYSVLTGGAGYKGLWRGLAPTLVRDVPFSAVYWTGYEFMKARLSLMIPQHRKKNRGSSFLVHFASGAVSGTIAAVITTPIDVVKTNTQVTHPSERKTAMDIFKTIIMEDGWRGLTKGIVPRAVKVAPACAIMISSYELIKAINHEPIDDLD